MHPLEMYYLNQAGRGLTVYSATLYLQRSHGIGNFFCSLYRWVRRLLLSRAKAVGRETLRTDGKILTEIAARKSTDYVNAEDIMSKHVTESVQNLISKLRGWATNTPGRLREVRRRGIPNLKDQACQKNNKK